MSSTAPSAPSPPPEADVAPAPEADATPAAPDVYATPAAPEADPALVAQAVPVAHIAPTTPATPAPAFADAVRRRVAEAVVGQDAAVERLLIALLTGGHLLLQGAPGLAKTLLVHTLSKAVDLRFNRVQCTVDLLPADVLGSEILDQKVGEYRTHLGPVFTNLLLVDEINRAAPRTQAALLEAMQERRVTIGNRSIPLPAPFLVVATQHAADDAGGGGSMGGGGTSDLPDPQLDRFLLCHRLAYPSAAEEEQILRRHLAPAGAAGAAGASGPGGPIGDNRAPAAPLHPPTPFDVPAGPPVVTSTQLAAAMAAVRDVYVSDVFLTHCVGLVRRTRASPHLDRGAGPRAGVALTQAARARAYLHGRDFVVPEDLSALADDVLLHRMRLTYEAAADGLTPAEVLKEIMAEVG